MHAVAPTEASAGPASCGAGVRADANWVLASPVFALHASRQRPRLTQAVDAAALRNTLATTVVALVHRAPACSHILHLQSLASQLARLQIALLSW